MKEESGVSGERVGVLGQGDSSGFKRSKGAEGDSGPGKKQKSDGDKALAAAAAVASAATVVVDLSYDDLMTDKESASLATQVMKHLSSSSLSIHCHPLRFCLRCCHQHHH